MAMGEAYDKKTGKRIVPPGGVIWGVVPIEIADEVMKALGPGYKIVEQDDDKILSQSKSKSA